jgi:hypothetical protein
MKITEEFSFDEDQYLNVELKEKIKEISLEFVDCRKESRNHCIACDFPEYSYAFEKQGFHYIQCKKCSTLYLNNPINKKNYLAYKGKLVEIYKKKSVRDYLKNLYEKKMFTEILKEGGFIE